jgi:hypothetical protein
MQTNTISDYDERVAYEVPIMIAKKDTEFYHQAKMYNFGGKNMYFESAFDAQPGSDIHIQMNDCSHNGIVLGESRNYRAKVLWCKEILDSYTFYYGVNVQISEQA